MLILSNVEVIYSNVILVLRGVSLEVSKGNMVALLGPNGAGKSTTLKAISGLLGIELGKVSDGYIEFEGTRIDKKSPQEIAKMGLLQVLEGRRVFEHLTAEENLLTVSHLRGDNRDIKDALNRIYEHFPRLREMRHKVAGYLSGGEQQMVVIGRALMGNPKIVLLDEPSLGLAPLLVRELFGIIRDINQQDENSMLLVEQNANVALSICDYGYIMEGGRIVLDGSSKDLLGNPDIQEFYLGLSELGRKNYREVKHYRRRKRWLG